MPHPEHRPPFRIADGLDQVRLWELIDRRITLSVECDACGHAALWTPLFMDRRLARSKAARLVNVAARVRCGRCRSAYVRIGRAKAVPNRGRRPAPDLP